MNEPRQQILIVLIAGIGDLVLASRAMRAIRKGYPDADIHLLTSTDASPIAKNYDFLTRIWSFPIRELRKSKRFLLDMMEIVHRLRGIHFDLIMNLYRVASRSGALKMGLLFLLLKGKIRIGQDAHGFGVFLTHKVRSDFLMNRHFAEAMLEIAQFAGGISDGKWTEIYWDRSSEDKWSHLLNRKAAGHLLIGINPGGDRENRRWDPVRYAAVADRLAERFDATVFLFGGPGEEEIAERIRNSMKHNAVDLSGKLSLNDLAFAISRLDLLVTNDSGPMHIGAATRTPLVALFGPENPRLLGPHTRPDLYRILYKDVPCRPCIPKRCEHCRCLDLITPEEVLDQCIEILKINKPHLCEKERPS